MEILEVGATAPGEVPTFAGFLDLEDIGAPVGGAARKDEKGAARTQPRGKVKIATAGFS